MTVIYCELKAHSAEEMRKVRECIEAGLPYKGRKICKNPPQKPAGVKITRGRGAPLLFGLCTHRLGYNCGRHA